MKTVVLKLDRYSKIILTVIAIALILIALRPFLPTELEANPRAVDVNIAEIGGYSTYGVLNVKVKNASEIGMYVDMWWSH